jgi:hypothetical protein
VKVPFTPFVRGIDRSISDTAQQPGGLRDCINVLPQSTGRMDGVYRNTDSIVTTTNTATRWIQWGSKTVVMRSNPAGAVEVVDGATKVTGPTETSTGIVYRGNIFLTGALSYASVDATDPFAKRCYLGVDSGTDWGDCTLSGAGTVTVTFGTKKPQRRGSAHPAYVVFNADSNEGSTTARIRACTNPTYSSTDLDTVDYVGDTVAGATRAMIIWDDGSNELIPTTFGTWRNRICAAVGNEVYFGGFQGNASPYFDPDQNDWTMWYELNTVTVGHSGQGNIIRMEPLGDSLIVFLEKATYRIYGYPPVNGAFDNQAVVQELNPTLGINSWDSVGRAPDGNALFVAANDGQAYAFTNDYILISEPVRLHPRWPTQSIVTVSEEYAIFTSTTIDPSKVPYEADPVEGGLLFQTPPAFVFNVAKAIWSILDQWSLTENLTLVPISDPHNRGIFGVYKRNNITEIALSEPGGINIANDTTLKVPQLSDTLAMGIATHQIPVAPMFRPDALVILAESAYVGRVSGALPAETPAGSAPAKRMRDIPTSTFGLTTRYALHNSSPDAHNFVSAGVGYWGENLIDGMQIWTPALTAITIDGTPTVQRFTNGQRVDRVDVLLANFVSGRVTIYNDNNGSPGSVAYYADCVTPQNGAVNTGTYYWRSFPVSITLPATYWVGLTGDCTAYRFPSNGDIEKSNAVIHAGYSLAMRVVEELGGCFSAKALLTVEAVGEPLPYAY